MSGSVPALKVTKSEYAPVSLQRESKYSTLSTAFISFSIGVATVSATTCGLAPEYVVETLTSVGATSG